MNHNHTTAGDRVDDIHHGQVMPCHSTLRYAIQLLIHHDTMFLTQCVAMLSTITTTTTTTTTHHHPPSPPTTTTSDDKCCQLLASSNIISLLYQVRYNTQHNTTQINSLQYATQLNSIRPSPGPITTHPPSNYPLPYSLSSILCFPSSPC